MVRSLNRDSLRDATPIIGYNSEGEEIGMGFVTDDINVNEVVAKLREKSSVVEIRTGNNLLWKR